MGFNPGTSHTSEPNRPEIWRKVFALTTISGSPGVYPDFILVTFMTSQKCRCWGLCRHLWSWLLATQRSSRYGALSGTAHPQLLWEGRLDRKWNKHLSNTTAVLENICNGSLFKWRAFTTPCGNRSSGRKFFIIRGTLRRFLNML